MGGGGEAVDLQNQEKPLMSSAVMDGGKRGKGGVGVGVVGFKSA